MGAGRGLSNGLKVKGGFEQRDLRVHEPKQHMPNGIGYPLRAGYAVRKLPRGRREAPFFSVSAANRAIKRAERWLRNQAKGPDSKPPFHIIANADKADRQFGRRG